MDDFGNSLGLFDNVFDLYRQTTQAYGSWCVYGWQYAPTGWVSYEDCAEPHRVVV